MCGLVRILLGTGECSTGCESGAFSDDDEDEDEDDGAAEHSDHTSLLG